MDINKALRKQKKSYNRFMFSMCFIFLLLPILLYITEHFSLFFISYLIFIEIIILIAIIYRIKSESLRFELNMDKLKIKPSIFSAWCTINCDKVALLHTEQLDSSISIIIVMTSRFRSKIIKPIDKEFLKKHSYLSHEYSKMKKLNPEKDYYYLIVSNGGDVKYALLLSIYKSCVKAFFTEEAIEDIKKWRSN